MSFSKLRTLIAIPALFAITSAAAAQQTSQTGQAVQAPPELIIQLRQLIATSGLTKEQVHARLRAEGYPEDMLDAFFPGSTVPMPEPGSVLYGVLRELGIADSSDVSFLRRLQSDSLSFALRDSLLRAGDTLRADSTMFRSLRIRADIADSMARSDSGYNIFGMEFFRSLDSEFEPLLHGPVDANYRLGPGDILTLILTGDVEALYALDVTREGFVVIPQVGQLYIANLTLGQLEDVLYSRLGRVYSGVRRGPGATARFTVSVTKLRTNQVYVLGEVEKPGSYSVSSASTAMTALYAAGGPSPNGSMRRVHIKRGGQIAAEFDLYDYLLLGDGSRDARLETGDIIFVPPRGMRVRIVGEVVRPATYEMKPNETLADLIRAAGGFHANASRRRVQIQRILPPDQRGEGRERVTMDVESQDFANGHPPEIQLEPGDVVRVFSVSARLRNTVEVKGNVWTPGRVGLTPGMMISDAIRLAGGPKPDVYLGQVLVDRLRPDSARVQLRASLRDSLGAVVGDFPLLEDDIIQVFATTDFRPQRYVAIGGAVRSAGRFPYRRGMTMRDLVLLAGGLQESAYLTEAEIARLPEDRTGSVTATTIRVPLDSTYLFERRQGEPYFGPPGLQTAANGAPEVELRPYDNVLILQQPSWELQRTVAVSGEVKFPGTYALRTRDERLSDVIERAGGFTEEAYPEGTVFNRVKGTVGRVAIDVPKAMRDRRSPENLLLMDGDQVMVPQRSNIVTVEGAVNAPNVVAYVRGKDLEYYIDQAGGATRNGDEGRAYVTQPNGKREIDRRFTSPEPLPGSIVVVPEKPSDHRGVLDTLLDTTQSVGQLLVSLLAIYAILK